MSLHGGADNRIKDPWELLNELWNTPRDLISPGYDHALAVLMEQVPFAQMKVHEYPSGERCWTWTVPPAWECTEAYICSQSPVRNTFLHTDPMVYDGHPLHVIRYSEPFLGRIDREELEQHLIIRQDLPLNAVPYAASFYRDRWGMTASLTEQAQIKIADSFDVYIAAKKTLGTLKVGEFTLPGRSDKEIVFCAHLDHPYQANDGLSGVVAGIEIMRRLSKVKDRHFTYTFLIVPETIGSIAWLSHNEERIPNMIGGLFLEMMGTQDEPITLQMPWDEFSPFARCADPVHGMSNKRIGRTVGFLESAQNDERQFNAPGVRVPMFSMARCDDSHWPMKGYHSNQDTPQHMSISAMGDSIEVVMDWIDIWEQGLIVRSFPQGIFGYAPPLCYFAKKAARARRFAILRRRWAFYRGACSTIFPIKRRFWRSLWKS